MTRRAVPIAMFSALLLAAACAGPGSETIPAPMTYDTAADLAAIGKIRDGYAMAFKAGDAAAITAFFAADGLVMENGQPTASGAEGILAAMTGAFGMMASGDIEITPSKTDIVGDMAYETGTFKNSVTPKDAGAPVTDEGRYLVVFRRQADGSWKLVADMGNSSTMPGAAVPMMK